jgi:light-regulated signal transduction histidine kinase (bacteriophytochrome)
VALRLSDRQLAGLLAAGAVGIFVIDLLAPLGISVGMVYAPLVAATALLCTSTTAILLTLFYLALMGAELFLSAEPMSWDVRRLAVVNRGLAMLVVATMAGLMIPLRRMRSALADSVLARSHATEEIRRLNAELEERVERRTEQLAAVNKELEAFTYSVSHDLRAPLRGMSGFARVLEEDYGERLDEDGKRYLEIIKSNAAQMGQLIDDLLALSRLGRQPLRATTLALEPLVREAFRQATADAPQASIEFTIDPLPECRGDANLMRQVFINLLSNAVKFSRHASPPRIQVGSKLVEDEVAFFVRDNGAGFDMRYAGKLFGVFQRLHGPEEFAGTGVGLAIVKRIVERHGGRVWAEGETGKGATFYFTLGDENCDGG